MSDAHAPDGRKFTKEDLLGYLAEVDAALPSGDHIRIALIGGAAVMFLVPGRVTDDVDVISEETPQVLEDAAAHVAHRHGLRPDWINDAARVGRPEVPVDLEPVFEGGRLTVYRAGLRFMLATKIRAGRPIDVADATNLALAAGITTEEALLDLVETAWPPALQTPRLSLTAQTVAAAVAERLRLAADPQAASEPSTAPGGVDV